MRKVLWVVLLALLAVWASPVCRAQEEEEGNVPPAQDEVPIAELMKDIPSLTDETFDDYLEEHPVFFAEFYAPWCAHCKQVAPEFVAASKQTEVPFVKIDATEQVNLAARYGVEQYPSIFIFKNGQRTEFSGERSVAEILSFIKSSTRETTFDKYASAEELKAAVDQSTVLVVGFVEHVDGLESKEFKRFTRFADEAFASDKSTALGFTSDRAALTTVLPADAAPFPSPSVVLFKKYEAPAVYTGTWTVASLLAWFKTNKANKVPEIGPSNYQEVTSRGLPLYLVWVPFKQAAAQGEGLEKDRIVSILYKLHDKYSDKVIFGYSDAETYKEVVHQFGLTKGLFPSISIVSMTDSRKFILEEPDLVLTEELLDKHVSDYLAGTLQPFVKKQPVPTIPEEDNVRVVVYDNFEGIVHDTTKDVLVEFYAPWCGHCQALAPKYSQLATLIKNKGIQDIVIAKMDLDGNDLPPAAQDLPISGFPTIFFFPAKDKTAPLPYEGAREVKDILKFLKDSKTVKASGLSKIKVPKTVTAEHEHEHGVEEHEHGHEHDEQHGGHSHHAHEHVHEETGEAHTHEHDHVTDHVHDVDEQHETAQDEEEEGEAEQEEVEEEEEEEEVQSSKKKSKEKGKEKEKEKGKKDKKDKKKDKKYKDEL